MIALLVIDMQVALFEGAARYDADGVVHRVNDLARAVALAVGAEGEVVDDQGVAARPLGDGPAPAGERLRRRSPAIHPSRARLSC